MINTESQQEALTQAVGFRHSEKPLVTIPFWGLPTTHAEEQEGYDEEELLRMHVTSR